MLVYIPPEVETMPRPLNIVPTLAVLALMCVPLQALEYEIRLVNGNVFHSRYEPVVAPFDDTKLLFMTTFGNSVAVPRNVVGEVISLTEAAGFGTRLDAMTILIGMAANDNPTPEEEAALAAQGAGIDPAAPYSMPLVGEPDQTGGIPLQFLNFNTPPLGAAGAGGGAADQRRGGGGTQFVEPQTRD
jgi:hypothetical protein